MHRDTLIRSTRTWSIATGCNRGFFPVFLNWLWHLKEHTTAVTHIVFWADDPWTFARVAELKPRIEALTGTSMTALQTGNTPNASTYGSPGYSLIGATRPALLLDALTSTVDQQHHWILMDIDALVVGDIFGQLNAMSMQRYEVHQLGEKAADAGNGGPFKKGQYAGFCTGFIALHNTERMRALVSNWSADLSTKNHTVSNQQNSYRKVCMRAVYRMQLKVHWLPASSFTNGPAFFKSPSRWPRAVLAHTTQVRGGIRAKVRLMSMAGRWKCGEQARALNLSESHCVVAPLGRVSRNGRRGH